MKHFNLIVLLMAVFATVALGQTRYIDEVFTSVSVEQDVVYANNVSVLTDPPAPIDLTMDIYTPVGDTVTNRPLLLYFHTGSFLPQYVNGQVTGGKRDSTIVEICKRFARKGYVTASVTYRAGWLPTAQEQDTRTGTLLNAAYRGVQDAKACNRFFRMTAAEMENPYGIDVDRIACWGQGTGGYVTLGTYLDDFAEIELDKFIDSRTLTNYVDTNLVGNVDGTSAGVINIPNNPTYSNKFAFVVNMGGAMGDSTWIDGDPSKEAPLVCFHPETDPFAPFFAGAVTVPVTGQFVVNVSGGRQAVEIANRTGLNAPLQVVNDEDNELNQIVDQLSTISTTDLALNTFTLATDNFYPFVTTLPALSGPWEWFSEAEARAEMQFLNDNLNLGLNIDGIIGSASLTNPNIFNKEEAIKYIDTLDMYVTPRAFYAMNLADATSVDIVEAAEIGLNVYPNPAINQVTFEAAPEHNIIDLGIYNLEGRQVGGALNVNRNKFIYNTNHLDQGMYIVRLRFKNGISTQRLLISKE